MTQEITFKSIGEKLFEAIFSDEKYKKDNITKDALPLLEIQKKNEKYQLMLEKAINSFFIDNDIQKLKKVASQVITTPIDLNDTYGKYDSFDFELNYQKYNFKRNFNSNIEIKLQPNEQNIDKKYLQNVSSNLEEAKNTIIEMAKTVEFRDVADITYDSSASTYMTVIYSSYNGKLNLITEPFISLVEEFKDLFTDEEILLLRTRKYIKTKKAEINIDEMFNRWFDFLKAGSHTFENPYVFNDLDNEAFIKENEEYILLSQKNQNTLFAYIKEKDTSRIKVFNYAQKIEFDKDIEEYFKNSNNYIQLFKKLNYHYSYENYFFDFESKLYPRFWEYYFENFQTEDNLIYDSNFGFKLSSYYTTALEEDFELLNSDFLFEDFEE